MIETSQRPVSAAIRSFSQKSSKKKCHFYQKNEIFD